MGEVNNYAMDRIAELTGHRPVYGETEDGRQFLQIGDATIVAQSGGLWGDPSIWECGDGTLSVAWGGTGAQIWVKS